MYYNIFHNLVDGNVIISVKPPLPKALPLLKIADEKILLFFNEKFCGPRLNIRKI